MFYFENCFTRETEENQRNLRRNGKRPIKFSEFARLLAFIKYITEFLLEKPINPLTLKIFLEFCEKKKILCHINKSAFHISIINPHKYGVYTPIFSIS